MSRNWYIADTHFGHVNCIQYDDRPYETIEESDAALIANWNEVVMPDDHVYVVGDFAYKNSRHVFEYTSALRGHIHLIRGNHDIRSEDYESCFESCDDMLVVEDSFHGETCEVFLCHYWIPFAPNQNRGAFVLHGHTHMMKEAGLEEEMKEMIRRNGIRCEAYNVGCMYQNYYPQTLEQIVARQEQFRVPDSESRDQGISGHRGS